MAGISAPRLLLSLSTFVSLAHHEPNTAPPQCSYTVRAIRFGFQFTMTSCPTGSYTISVGEKDGPVTVEKHNISSYDKNPRHEIQHLKPCAEYEHNVTFLDINGAETLCGGSGGKTKTLSMNEQDIKNSSCVPGYVCYQSGWNVSSSVSAANKVQAEQLGDGTFGFQLEQEDFCSTFTIIFNQDNCNNSSFNITQYISADFLNPNKINQTKHNRLPAEIETKLPPNCKNLSIDYTCSERGKVGDFLQLSDLEPFTDYICMGLIQNNDVFINKTTPAVQFNVNCDLIFSNLRHNTTEHFVSLWGEITSENCDAVLPNLEKLFFICSCQETDGVTKHRGKVTREPGGGRCETDGLKAYTVYTFNIYPTYNNKKVSQGITFDWRTKAGVPDKVQHLNVHLVKRNVIRVTCSEPAGGFKGPEKVYIVRLVGDRQVEQTDECDFEIGGLSYLTSYTVEVVASNGEFESEAEAAQVATRYNQSVLNGSLISLLILLIIILIALRLGLFIRKQRKSKNVAQELMLAPSAKSCR